MIFPTSVYNEAIPNSGAEEEAARVLEEKGYDAEFVAEKDKNVDLNSDNPVIDELRGFSDNERAMWIDASRELYSLFVRPQERRKGSLRGRQQQRFYEEDDFFGDLTMPPQLNDDEIGQWGLELMGRYNYRPETQLSFFDEVENMTERQQAAFFSLLQGYDKLPDGTWSGTKRMLGNLATSPSTYLSLGTLGTAFLARLAFKSAGKTGVMNYIRSLMPTAIATGVESGAYASLDDAMRQQAAIAAEQQKEFDLSKNLVATGVGTVLGAGLGMGLPAVAKGGVELAKGANNALGAVVDRMGGGQVLSSGVGPVDTPGIASIRQKQIPPSKPAPTVEELQAARGDTRKGADIVGDRLDIIVPETERVIGGTYVAGRPDGSDWSTLTPAELAVRGPGFPGTDETLERIWQETLSEASAAAKEAVERTGANWSAFKAADWDAALKLPLRSQLWYELSGEKFIQNLPGLNQQEHMMFLDLIGATSARAKPGENLERALAVLSQRLRGVPVDVDVTIQSTVSDALRRGGTEVSSDLANKTGMFSDTLALTAGLPVRYPISVNDVWVGRAFGIEDAEMSANQSLHEVFGKYMNKVRDVANGGIGDNSGNYPHQSWHLQARQWVQLRAADDGIDTSKGVEIEGSDYAGEWGGVVKKLEDAGISVPGGIITRDILLDPRLADSLRKTTPAFRQAPKATVEFGTLLTPNGKRGADLFEAARQSGDGSTQKEYLKLLTTTMYKSGRGKPTLWEKTVRLSTGGSDKVTRIYSPTAEDPFAISGTFEGAAAPNIRVPLKDMSPDQIAYFNAMAGQGLKQKAMAAAQVRRTVPGEALKDGEVETSSIRFDWDGAVPEELIIGISRALGDGFEISAMRYPDGVVVDVNPRFGDAGPEGPDVDAIDAAIEFLIKSHNVKNVKEFPSAFKSEYGKNYVEDAGDGEEYRRIIEETLKGWEDGAATKIVELTGGGISEATAVKFLRGESKLDVSTADLKEGIKISSVRGRAETIRKTLQRRLSDHDDAVKSWEAIGGNLDAKMGEAIPKWERRATKLATKQNPPTQAVEE